MALERKRQKDINVKLQYPLTRPQNVQQNFRQKNVQRNAQSYVPQRNIQQTYAPQRSTQQADNQQNMQQNQRTVPSYQNRDTNYDNSMRSRRSNQMSGISYRSGNQINYNEQNNDTNENTIDNLNFQVDQMEYQNP